MGSVTQQLYRKSFKVVEFKAGATPGEYEAIVSVFNNVDDGGDRVLPGAFADDIAANPTPPVVWSHMWGVPPIGETLEWKENDVGLWVHSRLFIGKDEDHQYARMCYAGMKSGALREFSFAYEILDGGYVTENGTEIYDLRKLAVFEHGPCLVGMNRETELLQVAGRPGLPEHQTPAGGQKRERISVTAPAAKDGVLDGLDQAAGLVASIDATLDAALEALPDDVPTAVGLLTALDVVVDELMDAMGIPDPDEPDEPADTGEGKTSGDIPANLETVTTLMAKTRHVQEDK
jgi:hypothetical protein